jgi:hypothetical protein
MAQAALALKRSAPVLGRYRPIRPLGSGGSGSVWLAHDDETGMEVALKMVPREGRAAARAEREAEAAARLRHPACLRAYDFGHDARHVYIVYEYVPGRTLREAMRAGALDDASAVEAAAQILEGLAHAHARGVVHRDVKPANVILAEGEGVTVRILDFGLALMDHADTLTASGDVPGTLAYVPPERLAGEDATPASDVWAVGVLLWESLAGGHPFWKSSLLDAAKAIQEGAPPLATARPDLPRALSTAVDRALSLDPAERPSAAELADELRGAARPRQKEARRPIVPQDLQDRLVRIGPDRWAGVALTGLAAGLGAASLPFYPAGWAYVIALLAATIAAFRPRAGLALALAAPILPLGNLSLGLAVAYSAFAVLWLIAFAGEPGWGGLPALGALLGPIGALALAPAAALRVKSPVRRAVAAGGIVLAGAAAAGIRGAALPFGGDAPARLGVAGTDDAKGAADAVVGLLASHSGLAAAAGALAVAAALLPLARTRGAWAIAGLGAAIVPVMLLPFPSVDALPVVAGAWAVCVPLIVRTGS